MRSPLRPRARVALPLLIALTLAAWLLPSFLSAERYRRRLETALERKLMRPVTFSALSYRMLPRPGFSIYNVVVKDDPQFGAEPFARAERIDCDLRWRSLWRSRLDFTALHLVSPTFNVVRSAGGEWNVENLLRRSGATLPSKLSPLDDPQGGDIDLEASGARLNFKLGAEKKPFAVTDVEARLRIEQGRRLVRFGLAGNPIRTDGALATPGKLELSGEWMPGLELDGPLDATLRTRGSLLYNWVPLLSGHNPEIYGVLDFDARLTGSLRSLKIEGRGSLNQLHRWESLPPSGSMTVSFSLRGTFDRTRGKAEFESLDALFAGSRLHMTGSVEKIPASPEVDLVIAVERSRVEDLLALGHRLSGLSGSLGVSGRVDGLLTIQGRWNARRYGGFALAREVQLHASSGTFSVSDLDVKIDDQEARLAPARITLTPRLELGVEGVLASTGPVTKVPRPSVYDLLISAKAAPLDDLVGFARGLGIRTAQELEAEGGVTLRLHLTGAAWPPAAPALAGSAELHGVRVLVPGVTEPIGLTEGHVQVNGDHIVADPLVGVIGGSTFVGRLEHQGDRSRPWVFNLRGSKLSLEEGSLWFDVLGHRTAIPLVERIPGLRSLAARRTAGASLFSALSAQGSFATPAIAYRSLMLTDVRTFVEVSGRKIRLSKTSFRAAGGRGHGDMEVDLSESPASISGDATVEGVKVQALAARFPAALRNARGLLSGDGHFQTRGLTRQEFAANLLGQATVRLRSVSLGGFDPLSAAARAISWGELDPGRGDVVLRSATALLQIRDGRITLSHSPLEISGALLRLSGSYAFDGTLDMDVHADFRHVTRRWIDVADDSMPGERVTQFHLLGAPDRLTVVPGVQVSRAHQPQQETSKQGTSAVDRQIR
jgi:hypothetical protein